MAPVDKSPNRAHGRFTPNYSCQSSWGIGFLLTAALIAAAYVGGGSVLGARSGAPAFCGVAGAPEPGP